MSFEIIESETETKPSAVNFGGLPIGATAQEVFEAVRDRVNQIGEPLKAKSYSLDASMDTLPAKWEEWTVEDCERAGILYDQISAHLKTITDPAKKTSELDQIVTKAFKLHRGLTAGLSDIQGPLPDDKDRLMTSIRAWRKREDERAAEEAKRKAEEARQQEEDRRLQEALALDQEAERLRAAGQGALADEVRQEAEAVVNEEAFIPPPPVQANIPKGGPKRQTFWKFQVVDFSKLPEKFKMANDQMIRATVNAQKNLTDIPGVKVWPE